MIAIISILVALGFLLLRSGNRMGYYAFVKEDGIAESIQAICYLLSSFVAIGVARRLFRVKQTFLGVMFGLFAAGTFLLFGEEISWGQRIVGWESTEYFQQSNMQGETNLHNDSRLKGIVHPIGIALGIYMVISSLLQRSFVRRGAKVFTYFTGEWPVVGFFGIFTAIYVVYEYLNVFIRPWYGFDLILWQDLEMAESFLTAGILFWTILKLRSVEKLFGPAALGAAKPAGGQYERPEQRGGVEVSGGNLSTG